MRTYPVEIAGVRRELPIVQVGPGVAVALLNLLGDTELTEAAAEALAKRLPPEVEVLVTPEVKAVPLAHALSRITGKPYVVARRRRRPYMEDPIIQEVQTLTLGVGEVLWLDRRFAEKLLNQRVVLVSDVVASGETMRAMEKMVLRAGGHVVARLAVFRQGTPGLAVDTVAELPVL